MPPTWASDEPVSISSVYDVAVFVTEKFDARLSKLEVVPFPASLA